MKYVEFLVFLCRIAKEHYDGSPYEKESAYLKLDHLMPAFLKEAKVEPNFLFGDKFEYEKELEKKRKRRNKRKVLKAKRQAQIEGKDFNPKAVKGLVPASADQDQLTTGDQKSQLTRANAADDSSGEDIDIDKVSSSEEEAVLPNIHSGAQSPRDPIVSAVGAASIP